MNAPQIGVGFTTSPTSPDYLELNNKDQQQELINNKVQQGSGGQKGVVLTQDSLEVALEYAFGITDDRSESSRPSLSPLFRTRFVEDQQSNDISRNYYEELRNALPSELKNQLIQDEKQAFEDRDPDIVAFDRSLRFAANLLTTLEKFSMPIPDDHIGLIAAQTFINLPSQIKNELLNKSTDIQNFLDKHLATVGPNDPSFDLFLNTSNQIDQAIDLLKNS